MTAARIYLCATLQRIVDGGDLTSEELDAAIPDSRLLDDDEKKAWEELSHWVDDDDIQRTTAIQPSNKIGCEVTLHPYVLNERFHP